MTKSSDDSGKQTLELPAVTPEEIEEAPEGAHTADAEAMGKAGKTVKAGRPGKASKTGKAGKAAAVDMQDTDVAGNPRETIELEAITPGDAGEAGPSAEMSGPVPATPPHVADAMDDPDATEPLASITPIEAPPPERPRLNTLASITRPRGGTNPHGASLPPPEPEPEPVDPGFPEPIEFSADGIPDETEGAGHDEGEWAIADQPTVALAPGSVLSARPRYLDTDEHANWPPSPSSRPPLPANLPEAAASLHRRAIPRPDRTGLRRYASPNGRPMPGPPPTDIPRTAFPDPRMQRYQELHRQRDAIERGDRGPDADRYVTERVRQWWSDLRPGLQKALDYQHEARASGVRPIPAQESAPSSRLGDVFGRLTASARGLTGRAQPAFKRLHDQAEQAAQAIVGRFEGDLARQQAPFLGPGRIAVFFRSGVSVGQAQRLLSSNDARPLRIIPRKHGFLAYVLPGNEEQISRRLRVHPYVRDVVYMVVNAYDDPDEPEPYE